MLYFFVLLLKWCLFNFDGIDYNYVIELFDSIGEAKCYIFVIIVDMVGFYFGKCYFDYIDFCLYLLLFIDIGYIV